MIQLHFIVGNGPSLRGEDLSVLKHNGIICYGCNGIFEMFKNTSWRPDYYVVSDYQVWRRIYEPFLAYIESIKAAFITDFYYDNYELPKNCYRYNLAPFKTDRRYSNNIANVIFSGGTVVYSMIQIATYMGFEEIYLLGVDCTNMGHFYDSNQISHDRNESWDVRSWMVSYWREAFFLSKEFARTNGIKIYNATRGGALDVFERVDFDTLGLKQ